MGYFLRNKSPALNFWLGAHLKIIILYTVYTLLRRVPRSSAGCDLLVKAVHELETRENYCPTEGEAWEIMVRSKTHDQEIPLFPVYKSHSILKTYRCAITVSIWFPPIDFYHYIIDVWPAMLMKTWRRLLLYPWNWGFVPYWCLLLFPKPQRIRIGNQLRWFASFNVKLHSNRR